jgi:hypothetical protein
MRLHDGLVDCCRQAEVIGINDQPFHPHSAGLGQGQVELPPPPGEVSHIAPTNKSPGQPKRDFMLSLSKAFLIRATLP